MRKRLADRIRELCDKAVNATGDDVASIIKELQVALREHNEQLRQLAAQSLGPDKLN